MLDNSYLEILLESIRQTLSLGFDGGAFIAFFIVIFLVVLAVLWFLLPFAVFGIYYQLRELNRRAKKSSDMLESIQMKEREGKRPDPLGVDE